MDFGPHLFLAVLEGTVTAAVLALTALGLSLVFGVMRVVNVAHGEFFMLGAVLAWWFASLVSGTPALGFLIALVPAPRWQVSFRPSMDRRRDSRQYVAVRSGGSAATYGGFEMMRSYEP